MFAPWRLSFFFFFNDTATTEIYTLSLHDALPISVATVDVARLFEDRSRDDVDFAEVKGDRKSTRLNSSHDQISYAVFCLKKKKRQTRQPPSALVGEARMTPARRTRRSLPR